MTQKFTAEEVRRAVVQMRVVNLGELQVEQMLIAYADTLSKPADSGRGNTPIAELMAEYTEEGCDFTNMTWVRKTALRYVETMPDKQTRCLLYALAAQGQGEPVAWLVVDANGKRFTIYNHALAKAIKQSAEQLGSTLTVKGVCEIPPLGWYCTRQPGHEGPCAAWENTPPAPPAGVPDAKTEMDYEYDAEGMLDPYHSGHMDGWNDCRKARLAGAPSAPEGGEVGL